MISNELLFQFKSLFLKLRTVTNQQRYFVFNIMDRKEGQNVGELIEKSGLSQPIVSQCLSVLKKARLVECEKNKKNVFYKTNKSEVEKLIAIVNDNNEFVNETASECVSKNMSKLIYFQNLLKTITNEGRLSIINQLTNNSEMNVTLISETLFMKQSVTSHHLQILKSYQLIKEKKEKTSVIYSLNEGEWNNIVNKVKQYFKAQEEANIVG